MTRLYSKDGMTKHRILVTRVVPDSVLELLRPACEIEMNPEDRLLPADVLRRKAADKHGILSNAPDPIDAALLATANELKVVAQVASGYENIDVAAATQHGVAVTNTPGILADATADYTWGLLLAVARRIPEADRYVRGGRWDRFQMTLLLGAEISGKTLGVVGMGGIGRAVARRAAGFGMRVLYHGRKRLDATVEEELRVQWAELPSLLQEADFVSLHVSLTKETTGLMGEAELRRMRSSAYLINTSRGPVVDEPALIRALQEGWIAGAALDVFEHEPEVPRALQDMENVVLSPHIGSGAAAVRERMALMAANSLLAVLRGDKPPNLLNPAPR